MNTEKREKWPIELEDIMCDFRSSKAYLWGSIKELLKAKVGDGEGISMLDAACHELIGKKIFPAKSKYSGVDISDERLEKAMKKKDLNDYLYKADLTKKIYVSGLYEYVVSCNTMSHIIEEDRELFAYNLIQLTKKGGNLILNMPIDQTLGKIGGIFSEEFKDISTCYYDSYKSERDEKNNLINITNIREKLLENEMLIPNEAHLNKQVIICGWEKLSETVYNKGNGGDKKSIIKWNETPKVTKIKVTSDEKGIKIVAENDRETTIIMTSKKLANNNTFKKQLIMQKQTSRLIEDAEYCEPGQIIYIFGLEREWIDKKQDDVRKNLNRLKKISKEVIIVWIEKRDGIKTIPSTLMNDN